MQQNTNAYYDVLSNLPTDEHPNNPTEIEILDKLFVENKTTIHTLIKSAYEPFLVGLLFVAFSIPQMDFILNKFLPVTASSGIIMTGIKFIMIVLLFWFYKHMSYVMRNR